MSYRSNNKQRGAGNRPSHLTLVMEVTMKAASILLGMSGFLLMMAGVGTIESDHSISGVYLLVYAGISAIGLLTWIGGVLIWQATQE